MTLKLVWPPIVRTHLATVDKFKHFGFIFANTQINPTEPIIIGDDTGIGGHCLLFTHGSWLKLF